MNKQVEILDNDIEGVQSIGQAVAPVVEKAGQALAERRDTPVAMTPMEMVGRALEMGVSADILKQMMDLRDREEARNAKLAFTRAVAAAKSQLRPILKTREVDYTPQGKSRVNYRHEDLAGIEAQVTPILTENGLSYRFESDNGPEKPITVTCILEHIDGHSTRTPLSAGADTSGGKNSLQAIASAVTYLQRYTLKLALGLSVSHDDDGKAANDEAPPVFITEAQVMELRDLLDATGGNEARFLKFIKVDSLDRIYADAFDKAVNVIKSVKGAAA